MAEFCKSWGKHSQLGKCVSGSCVSLYRILYNGAALAEFCIGRSLIPLILFMFKLADSLREFFDFAEFC